MLMMVWSGLCATYTRLVSHPLSALPHPTPPSPSHVYIIAFPLPCALQVPRACVKNLFCSKKTGGAVKADSPRFHH